MLSVFLKTLENYLYIYIKFWSEALPEAGIQCCPYYKPHPANKYFVYKEIA